jgi:hypothetical protein
MQGRCDVLSRYLDGQYCPSPDPSDPGKAVLDIHIGGGNEQLEILANGWLRTVEQSAEGTLNFATVEAVLMTQPKGVTTIDRWHFQYADETHVYVNEHRGTGSVDIEFGGGRGGSLRVPIEAVEAYRFISDCRHAIGVCSMKTLTITQAWLEERGACADGIEAFAEVWPDGMPLTQENLVSSAAAGLTVEWLPEHLLSTTAYAEYERSIASVRAEYQRVTTTAYAEYLRAIAPAYAEYDRVAALAKAEYKRAIAPAQAEYDRVIAAAYAEYERAIALAEAEYDRVAALAKAEYKRAIALARAEYRRVIAAAIWDAWQVDDAGEGMVRNGSD